MIKALINNTSYLCQNKQGKHRGIGMAQLQNPSSRPSVGTNWANLNNKWILSGFHQYN